MIVTSSVVIEKQPMYLLCFLRQGFTVWPWLVWNSTRYIDQAGLELGVVLPASVFLALGLQVCTSAPRLGQPAVIWCSLPVGHREMLLCAASDRARLCSRLHVDNPLWYRSCSFVKCFD